MADKAIDELHRLADDLWGYSLWNVLDRGSVEKWGAEPCGEKLNDRLRSISDRIEREHAEELETKDAEIEQLREDLAERHEMTAEAREAVERLRGIDCECSGGGFRNLLMEALSVYWRNSAVSNNGRLRDRIIELIEHGNQGTAAARWLEKRGGLYCVSERWDAYVGIAATTLKKLGCYYHGISAAAALKSINVELDKRLMPLGMEWPRDRDGNPFDVRKLYDHGIGAIDFLRIGFSNGKQWASAESYDGLESAIGELAECQPEVLGADKLPINVGETVWCESGITDVPLMVVRRNETRAGNYICRTGTGVQFDHPAGDLTHTPPETQERIDEDAQRNPVPYVRDVLKRDNWDKLTEHQALRLMIPDIMRRQRELDARTMGGAR